MLEALKTHLVRFEGVIDDAVDLDKKKTIAEIFNLPLLTSALKWSIGVEKYFLETYARFKSIVVPQSCQKTYEELLTIYERAQDKISG